MDQLPPPPSKKAWQDVMSLAELPILEETRHRLHHRLRDEHISFQELAPLVEMDAALCLNLQRHAVRINPDCLHQITGAANCLSLIGFKEVVRLVKRLPIVSAKTEVEEEKLYRLMLHNAAYAGTLNACLSAMKQSNNQATAKWSGMLASAPLWIWILKESATRNWIYYLTLGQEATTASRMVFGQAIKEWQRLAMRLALPPLAMEFWKPDHWPTVRQWQSLRKLDPRDAEPKPNRELIHLCQQPAISLICANLLAVHTMALPFGKTFQRWLSITANMLGKPEPVLYSQLRQAMLSIAFQQQSAYGSGVYYWLSPAATQLPISLWIPKQEDKQIQPLSKSKPQTKPDPEPRPKGLNEANTDSKLTTVSKSPTNSPSLEQIREQVALHPDSFKDWHALVKNVIEAICQHAGADFAAILVRNPEHTKLRLVHQQGLPPADNNQQSNSLASLQISTETQNLFGKLMEKRAAIQVTPEKRSTLLRNLSSSTIDQLPNHFVLMSIDAGDRPIGLIMAGDFPEPTTHPKPHPKPHPLPNPNSNTAGKVSHSSLDYQIFRSLCQAACLGLKQLKQHRRTAQAKQNAKRA